MKRILLISFLALSSVLCGQTLLAPKQGGTGIGTYTAGDLIYASGTRTLSLLHKGTNGQVLTLSGGLPTWTTSGGGGGWDLDGNSNGALKYIGTNDNYPFPIYVNGTEAFRVVSNGHVSFPWQGTNGTSVTYGSNNGFDSTLAQNTVFGYQCLGGNGEQPGYPRTLTTGEKNAIFGTLGAFHLTTGNYNTLMGAEPGEFIEDAFSCTGIGFHTLNGNRSSQQNTAVGAGAMQGQYRVVGGQLTACNTFPVNSTAVGYNALSIDTTFDVNDAFGSQALEKLEAGYSNFAGGQQSLSRITGGYNNTALGNNAGGAVKGSPVGNTLIGTLAGYGDNTNTFSQNTILGASAGQSLSTGSGNVIIGYQSNATISATLSNSLWIDVGNNSIPLIYGNFSTQQIGLGTTSPNASAKLEITSTTQGFRITPMTATQASAITPAEGLILFVSDTNGTFTSIGLWDYENGAWHKL